MRFGTLATAAFIGLLISFATPSANAAAHGALSGSWARTAAVLAGDAQLTKEVRHRRWHRKRRKHRRLRRVLPGIYIAPGVYRGVRRHRHYHCHRRGRYCHRHRHGRGHHR